MEGVFIAVCDIDENYALNLSSVLASVIPESFKISTFTGLHPLREFAEKHHIEMLIISESAYEPEINETLKCNIVVLRETVGFEATDTYIVERFQSRENLVKDILNAIPECVNIKAVGRIAGKHWKVIGIYSPVRRCLQTTFALSMGQLIAQEHKTLYMNFENFSGFSGWFGTEFGSDILDFLYFYDCNKDKLSGKIPAMVHKLGKLDILPPAASYYDTYDRSGSKWVEIFQTIENCTEYEYLILDLTDSVQGLLQIMEYCDRIYTLVPQDRLSLMKLGQYESWMVDHLKADIIGKTMKFSLPKFEDIPERPEMLAHCELSEYVRAIINEDILEK